jgi:hypothetical protein
MTDEENIYQEAYTPLKHSGLGIASFIISIFLGIFDFFLVVIAGVVEATSPGGMDEKSAIAVVLGLLLFLGFGLSLVGIGLGIAGLIQKNRKKLFSVLGFIFNLAVVLVVLGIMVLGLMMS